MRLFGTLYAAVYLLMVLMAFILPFFSSEGYTIMGNSLSELGAQESPNGWVMNLIFMLLSIVTALMATKALRRYWVPLYLLYFFAASLFFTGVFRHAPMDKLFYLEGEHLAHSIFSTITGVAFSAYCIVISFYLSNRFEKASAITMCVLATGLSLAMFEFPDYRGVFQRALFVISFAWLFYSFVTFNFGKALKITPHEK